MESSKHVSTDMESSGHVSTDTENSGHVSIDMESSGHVSTGHGEARTHEWTKCGLSEGKGMKTESHTLIWARLEFTM